MKDIVFVDSYPVWYDNDDGLKKYIASVSILQSFVLRLLWWIIIYIDIYNFQQMT